MNYSRIYTDICNSAPKLSWKGERKHSPKWNNKDDQYREGHRIIPGCLGGKYVEENVVFLTPEEHYVVHQLLVKMHPEKNELLYAAHMMTVSKNGIQRGNKYYGWLRRKMSETMKKDFKGQRRSIKTEWKKGLIPWNKGLKLGKSNLSGTIWITNGKENKRIEKTDIIPEGWKRGQFKSHYTNNGKTGKRIISEETKRKMKESAKRRMHLVQRDSSGVFVRK